MPEVVVLGAGPTGLMAALEAARRGHSCTVVEAAPQVGGMAGSFELAGQRVDYGSHRLHPATSPHHLELIEELLGPDLQLRARSGRIHLGGRWVGFPLRATNLIRSLPLSMTAHLVNDSLHGLMGGFIAGLIGGVTGGLAGGPVSKPDPSFRDEVIQRFGVTVADEFYGPFATKLYGARPEHLSGELAHRRISASSPTDIARRLVRATRPAGRTFYYPKKGYGQIAERLADAAVDAGATIELGTPVTGVAVDSDRVSVSTGTRSHDSDVTLSTIPVQALARMTSPSPPAAVTDALAKLRTRAMILVYLVLDRPQYTAFDAHYIPGLDTTVARLSEPKNYRDGDDPAGTTVLCAEIACWTTDEIWSFPDSRLADLVSEDLELVGLPPTKYVACETRRLRSVYPVFDIDTTNARETVQEWTGSNDRLLTLGRQGLRAIDNLHHVMAMGQGAVEAISSHGTIDPDRWEAKLQDFARHTVED
ncbi:MAG: protoporphyrinogen/coproporphyrinogen oxidase [Acidimicrobiales bacterium]